ncbi:SynChlorMet cassette radical SAM/SPASM protein ScmF, partial [Fibrobacterota bacterium]
MKNQTVQDRFPLRNIYFYLTDSCNQRCRHCWISPRYQASGTPRTFLDTGLFQSIISQAKPLGLEEVKLTGGEPLLHPEFDALLETVKKENLHLTLETNGLLCTLELAEKIAACKRSFVSVSLDGAEADSHEWVRRTEGCFEQTVTGIKNLVEAGLKPQIIMTMMECNKGQTAELVTIAESLGAGSVKFNILQPASRSRNMFESGQNLSINELVKLGTWVENVLSRNSGIPLFFSHPLAFRPLGRMFSEHGPRCGVCGILKILGVLANGSYAMCGIGESVEDLVFGSALENNLNEIWHNTPILNELREGLPGRLKGTCSRCLLKEKCLGCCIAENFFTSKDLWNPFWYCEEAMKSGVFPRTRLR